MMGAYSAQNNQILSIPVRGFLKKLMSSGQEFMDDQVGDDTKDQDEQDGKIPPGAFFQLPFLPAAAFLVQALLQGVIQLVHIDLHILLVVDML